MGTCNDCQNENSLGLEVNRLNFFNLLETVIGAPPRVDEL